MGPPDDVVRDDGVPMIVLRPSNPAAVLASAKRALSDNTWTQERPNGIFIGWFVKRNGKPFAASDEGGDVPCIEGDIFIRVDATERMG